MIIKRNLLRNDNYEYLFYDGDNTLKIYLGYEDNLYFETFSYQDRDNISFEIDKTNIEIYNTFDKLYNDIKNSNVIEIENYNGIISLNSNDIQKLNDQFKFADSYKNIINNGVITFVSDYSVSDDLDLASYLQLIKTEDKYILNFCFNDFLSRNEVVVYNNDSRYEPFNTCFKNFYNKLSEYDPNYHQVHIEELLVDKMYNKTMNPTMYR